MSAPPPPKDVQEFQFKLLCRLKLFPSETNIRLESPVKLISSASKYGFIFVGTPTGVQCIITSSIISLQETRKNNRGTIAEYPRREFPLGCQPTHLDISCDNEMLSVVIPNQNCPIAHIYSVPSFGSKDISKMFELRLGNTPGVNVLDIQWNPGAPNILGAVLSDGSAVVYEFKDSGFSINSLPPNTCATCLCWSPKGKQVVIGSTNGSLTQYKPDLKQVKSFPPPQLSPNPLAVVSVHWLSSFQFAAIYKDVVDSSQKPVLVIVNVPKGAPVSYINYEEICLSSDNKRPEYFFIHQQAWNVLFTGCGSSMEVSVLGQLGDTPVWEQWQQDEAKRAELPLSENHQDVYNIGMSFDTSPQAKIPIGENKFLEPMPLVHLVSHTGVLSMFHTINILPTARNLCSPPQLLRDQSGVALFTVPKVEVSQIKIQDIPKAQSLAVSQTATSSFGALQQPATTQSQSLFSSLSLVSSTPQSQPLSQAPSFFNSTMLTPGQPGGFFSSLPSPGTPSQVTQAQSSFGAPQPSSFSSFSMGQPSQQPPPNLFSLPKVTQAPALLPTPPSTLGISLATTFPGSMVSQQTPKTTATSSGVPNSEVKNLSTSNMSFSNLGQTQISPFSFSSPKPSGPTPFGSSSTPSFTNVQLMKKQEPPMQIAETATLTAPSIAKQPEDDKDEKLTKVEDVIKEEEPVRVEEPEPDDTDYKNALYLEVQNFTSDLNQLRGIFKNIDFFIGEESQKRELKLKVDNLEEFGKDLKETTASQEAEVSALRGTLMETLSWFENVKNQHSLLTDNRCTLLRDSDKLDPTSQRRIKSIEQNLLYLESQIKQLTCDLEGLWEHQRGNSTMKQGLETPSLETIFQSIVAHQSILNRQKILVSNLENDVATKARKLHNSNPHLKIARGKYSTGETELSALAEKLLSTKLGDKEEPNVTLKEAANKYFVLASSQKNLTPTQESLLCEWHKKHKVIHTKVVKTPVISKEVLNLSMKTSKDYSTNQKDDSTPKKKEVSGSTQYSKLVGNSASSTSIKSANKSFSNNKSIESNIISSLSAGNISKHGGQAPKSLFTINIQNQEIPTTVSSSLVQGTSGTPPSEGVRTAQSAPKKEEPSARSEITHEGQSFQIKNIFPPSKSSVKINTEVQNPTSVGKSLFGSNLKLGGELSPAFKIESSVDSSKSLFGGTYSGEKKDIRNQEVSESSNSEEKDQALPVKTTSIFGPSPSFSFSGSVFSKPSSTVASTITPSLSPFASVTTSQALQTAPISEKSISNFGISELSGALPSSTKPESSLLNLNTTAKKEISSTGFSFSSVTASLPGQSIKTTVPSAVPKSPDSGKTGLVNQVVGGGAKSDSSLLTMVKGDSSEMFTFGQLPLGTTEAKETLQSQASVGNISSGLFSGISKTTTPSTIGFFNFSNPTSSTSMFGNTNPIKPPNTASVFAGSQTTLSSSTPVMTLSSATTTSLPSSETPPSTLPMFLSTHTPVTTSTVLPSNVELSSEASTPSSPTTKTTIAVPETSTSASVVPASSALTTVPAVSTLSNKSSPQQLTSTASTPSLFGTQSSSGINFGTPLATGLTFNAPTNTSVFETTTVTTSIPSLFAASLVTTSATPLFASASASTATTAPSVFGNSLTSTTSGSIFGTPTTTTSSGSIFGAQTTTTSGSLFGAPTPTTATSAGTLFGTPTTTTTTTSSGSIFGNPATTTTPSVFGSPVSAAATFGAVVTSSFSSPVTTTSASSSIFGAPATFGTPTTTVGAFGSPAVTTSSSSMFGAPISQTAFGAQTTSGSLFGVATTSAFGVQPTLPFGTPTTSSFGSAPTSGTSFFGQAICSPTTTSTTSVFGEPVFGQAAPSSTSIFGGAPAFGSKPSFAAGGNVFGQNANSGNFGASGGSMFGGSSSFSNAAQPQANPFQSSGGSIFGGGSFSSGGSPSVGQTGFGSPPSFQNKPAGFGANSGAPMFASQASFGSPPTFGGAATFGSPNKVFGSPNQQTVGFGSLTAPTQQQSSTFESLATQNTMTFGNLAQSAFGPSFGNNQPQPQPQPQQQNPSASYGGSSFNTWR